MIAALLSQIVENLAPLAVPASDVTESVGAAPMGGPLLRSTRASQPATPSPIVQPVQAALPWTWTVPTLGSVALNQWTLSDTLPSTAVNGAVYLPSLASFTDNYRAFLELIDSAKFPLKQDLAATKTAIQVPTGNPVDDPAPVGWTKVTNAAGNLEFRPIWSASSYPSDWVATAPGTSATYDMTSPDVRTALTSGDQALTAQAADGSSIPVATDSIQSVSLGFENAGLVRITPGSWFGSAVLQIAQSMGGPFVGSINPDVVFGPTGLLTQRANGILIGSQPKLQLNATGSVDSSLANATSVSVAGITLKNDDGTPVVSATSAGSSATYTVAPKYTDLYIVGVCVTSI